MRVCLLRRLCCLALACLTTTPLTAAETLTEQLASIQRVGREGQGHVEAMEAWAAVSSAPVEQLPTILAAMRDDNPLADNWLRAAVETIASGQLQRGGHLPQADLETYLADRTHSARSRRLAFEWITRVDTDARGRWIPQFLDDPCLELRRDAVALELERARTALDSKDNATAIRTYQKALAHARDLDQIEAAANALKELEQPVDLPSHFGFIMHWQLIGPFDNTDMSGFDRVYPPEEEIDLSADYPGKEQVVRWQAGATDDDYGKVDLNSLIGKHMGAAAYALAYFDVLEERPAELRLGCINANKIWLNGRLLTANHVYHAGTSIDQYVGRGQLKKGRNTILVKICQNEQTESWAQDWAFQLRVCDALGTAIRPADQSSIGTP